MNDEYDNFKEQVRSSADIVEVISGYVALKKRGHNFWGCCPFHGEKTPSFAVNPDKNMFYCFGCHCGGDIFRFIMKAENCSFIDALKLLAEKYGIPIPEKQKSAAEIEREKAAAQIMEANATAARFFQACLTKTPYGQPALAYLQGRGIGRDIIERFSLGFALNSYNALLTSLGRRGLQPQLLADAGLAAKGRNDSFYDKFRNRVMIPIRDPRGKIVGFGGRILGEGTPKYMNTGETRWFNKRGLLFGMDIAAKEIKSRGQAVVVEGYMDAISLHAAGVANTVASMGTAFAAEQAQLLKRMTGTVVFCYDSDSAGRRASVRAVSIARAAGLRVKVAGVPEGKDPDEFVRRYGAPAFMGVLEEAAEGMDFQVSEAIAQNNVATLAGKVEAVSNILPYLLECRNEIEVAEHIRRLAQRLTIDEGLILEEYRKAARKNSPRAPGSAAGQQPKVSAPAEAQAESLLLAAFIEQPELAEAYRGILTENEMLSEIAGRIYAGILEQYDGNAARISLLAEKLDEEAAAALAAILTRHIPAGEAPRIAEDCLRRLRKAFLEREYERHRQLAVEHERAGDRRFVDELELAQRIKNEIRELYGG